MLEGRGSPCAQRASSAHSPQSHPCLRHAAAGRRIGPTVRALLIALLWHQVYCNLRTLRHRINGVVVTWVVAIDPPGVRFPLNAQRFTFCEPSFSYNPRIHTSKCNSSIILTFSYSQLLQHERVATCESRRRGRRNRAVNLLAHTASSSLPHPTTQLLFVTLCSLSLGCVGLGRLAALVCSSHTSTRTSS
jgi:hypothetical protein